MGLESAILAGCGLLACGMVGSALVGAKMLGKSVEDAASMMEHSARRLPADLNQPATLVRERDEDGARPPPPLSCLCIRAFWLPLDDRANALILYTLCTAQRQTWTHIYGGQGGIHNMRSFTSTLCIDRVHTVAAMERPSGVAAAAKQRSSCRAEEASQGQPACRARSPQRNFRSSSWRISCLKVVGAQPCSC